MPQRIINPWKWQDYYGISQAIEVPPGQHVLYLSGQTSVDAEGRTRHPGDMAAQANQVIDNIETVLGDAGYTLANIVRLNLYVTDMDRFLLEASELLRKRLSKCRPSSTLLEVKRLIFSDLLLELEATAVR